MYLLDIILAKIGYKNLLSEKEIKRLEILNAMKEVKLLIDATENNFNNVTDSDSIDYYSYLLKAYKIRYNKLVKELKNISTKEEDNNIYIPTTQALVTEEKSL